MSDNRFTINFIDLFDWEKESDRHYYEMLKGPAFEEEEEIKPPEKQEAKIVLKHKRRKDGNNNIKTYKRSLLRTNKKGL